PHRYLCLPPEKTSGRAAARWMAIDPRCPGMYTAVVCLSQSRSKNKGSRRKLYLWTFDARYALSKRRRRASASPLSAIVRRASLVDEGPFPTDLHYYGHDAVEALDDGH